MRNLLLLAAVLALAGCGRIGPIRADGPASAIIYPRAYPYFPPGSQPGAPTGAAAPGTAPATLGTPLLVVPGITR